MAAATHPMVLPCREPGTCFRAVIQGPEATILHQVATAPPVCANVSAVPGRRPRPPLRFALRTGVNDRPPARRRRGQEPT